MIYKNKGTFTVGMLMEELKKFDKNDEVFVCADGDDHIDNEIQVTREECCVFLEID